MLGPALEQLSGGIDNLASSSSSFQLYGEVLVDHWAEGGGPSFSVKISVRQ